MNPAQLLAHFDRISEAPDAVPRLRRFVLDLAVRGKLVEQDAREGEACVAPTIEADLPFDIPEFWAWARVGDVAECRLGKMLDKARNRGTPRRYLRNINVRWFDFDLTDISEMRFEDSELDEFSLRRGDVLICEGGEPGRAAVWDEREANIYFQKAIHRVRFSRTVDPRFFVYGLRATADDGRLATYFTGVGIKHFTGKGVTSFRFPLPPRAEQHRIVAKVDELMALCDQLQAVQTEREQRRDRVAVASLHRLDQPPNDEAQFRGHAEFHLTHLARFATRPAHVQQLRQTILNLAVRGRLVSQDPRDEPGSKSIDRIRLEKKNLAERRIIKRQAPLPPIAVTELPLDRPSGWVLARLGDASTLITKGTTPTTYGHAFVRSGVNFIKVEAIKNNELNPENVTSFISPETDAFLNRSRLQAGDVLFSIAGSLGTCALVSGSVLPANTNQALAIIRGTHLAFLARFLLVALKSSVCDPALARARGGAMYNISLEDVRMMVVPIPPLAEQQRIVAKVDDLIAVCDQLEAQLTAAQTESRRLLEAVLHDALALAA